MELHQIVSVSKSIMCASYQIQVNHLISGTKFHNISNVIVLLFPEYLNTQEIQTIHEIACSIKRAVIDKNKILIR